ncbi:hypothetical protein CPC08DRAFT_763300 [Agrocybe pediades]|nr:hypothetical protein CPC08DRAFT_763300 [Agrocybe pediades]
MSADFDPTLYILPSRNANDPLYDREELGIIKKYKEKYLGATTAAERRQIIVGELCPELFNFWVITRQLSIDSLGKTQRVKDLLAYVRNTWRLQKSTRDRQPSFLVRKSDVVWDQMNKEVFAEIADLMGLEEADTRTEGWFDYRTKAIKNVIDGLDEHQLGKINEEVLRRRKQGNPEHIQRKMASKYILKRLDDSSRKNFLEMGALSLTFVLTKNEKGVFNIQCHDIIPQLLGIKADSFEDQNDSLVEQFQRSIFRYVEDLVAKKEGKAPKFGYNPSESYVQYIEIDRVTGFPRILPSIRECKEPKKVYEQVFRKYLCSQYEVATGSSRPVPYSSIVQNIKKFIDKQHLPKHWALKDPRNITMNDIKQFFDHIWQRQQLYPLNDVFRFKSVMSKRRNGEIMKAPYPDRSTWFTSPIDAAPATRVRAPPQDLLSKSQKGDTVPHERVIDFQNLYTLPESQASQTPPMHLDTSTRPPNAQPQPATFTPPLTLSGGFFGATSPPLNQSSPGELEAAPIYTGLSLRATPPAENQFLRQHLPNTQAPLLSLDPTHWPQPFEQFQDIARDKVVNNNAHISPNAADTPTGFEDVLDPILRNEGMVEDAINPNNVEPNLQDRNEDAIMGGGIENETVGVGGEEQFGKAGGNRQEPNVPTIEKSKHRGKKRHGPDDQALEEASKYQVSAKRVRKLKVRES